MKRCLPILIDLCLALAFFSLPAQAMDYSMGLRHFAKELEFYYEKPRQEILKPALLAMSREGSLKRSEVRLFMAAFLSELASEKKIDPEAFADFCLQLGPDGRHLAAWLLHLSGIADKKKRLETLLPKDEVLRKQILRTPSSLKKMRPDSDRTVLQMYWASFMASGNPFWLDAIIDAAIDWHEAQSQGRKGSPAGSIAAASLYEFAGRHELARKHLRARLEQKNAKGKEILNMILERR